LALPGSPSLPFTTTTGLPLRAAAPAAQVDAFGEVDELSRGHPAHRAEDLLMLGQADVGEPVQASG
jgi:hypothetical protein